MKYVHKLVAILLVICFIPSGLVTVNAEWGGTGLKSDIAFPIIPDENGQVETNVIKDPVIDDTPGYYPEIFTITGVQVYQILTSNHGGKSFRKSDLPSNAVRIICVAQLSHSLQDSQDFIVLPDNVIAGICHWEYNSSTSSGYYKPDFCEHVPQGGFGSLFEFDIQISQITQYKDIYTGQEYEYFSYMKNEDNRGYVFGTVGLYYSYN